jgi:hypothetical protein
LQHLLLVSCNVNVAVCLVEWWVNISKSGAWLWLCLIGANNLATIWLQSGQQSSL